jgi:hypothetical protein
MTFFPLRPSLGGFFTVILPFHHPVKSSGSATPCPAGECRAKRGTAPIAMTPLAAAIPLRGRWRLKGRSGEGEQGGRSAAGAEHGAQLLAARTF